MMKDTSIREDVIQHDNPTSLAVCPVCGQKLVDIVDLSGTMEIRIKCRRCKTFIRVHSINTD